MRRYIGALTLFFLLGSPVVLAQAKRNAWEWTTDERIAQRVQASPRANIIIGSETPELFLPFELFPYLVRDGFAYDTSERELNRQRLAPIIAQFGDPNQFWTALESATVDYAQNQHEEERLAARLNNAASAEERQSILREIQSVQVPQCALRADALEIASRTIGRANLYRVLYVGIAPGIAMRSAEAENPSGLRFVAGGCR